MALMDKIIPGSWGWLGYVGLVTHNAFLQFHRACRTCYCTLKIIKRFLFFPSHKYIFWGGFWPGWLCNHLSPFNPGEGDLAKQEEKHWNVIDQSRNKMRNLGSGMFRPHVSIPLGWSVYPDSSPPGHRYHPAGMINALLCCRAGGCLSAVSFSFPVLLPDISLMWLDNEEIDSDHYAARKE